MTTKLKYLPVFIIVWEFSQIRSLGWREKGSQQFLFLCLFQRRNNVTISSRQLCILRERKGRRISEKEREKGGGQGGGGLGEAGSGWGRTAGKKAGVGIG